MTALRSIVAATDLSAPARRAADRAARIAHSASASLMLVHAVSGSALDELRRWRDTDGGAGQSILDDARERLHELAAQLRDRYGIDVDERIVAGHAIEEIVRVAHDEQADLVVTGTLGAGFFRNRLVGATAERVVRKSAQPVLMVRQAPHEPYRRVLVPVDFSGWSEPSIAIAIAVAPVAHFVLMHAIEVPFESRLRFAGVDDQRIGEYRAAARTKAKQRIADLAARAGLDNARRTVIAADGRGDPWMQIVQQEQEQDCDLIVVGKHGRNALEDLLFGSTTHMVITEASCDVLVSTHGHA